MRDRNRLISDSEKYILNTFPQFLYYQNLFYRKIGEKMQGIYQIRNTANGKIYIGSSVDIERRWMEHEIRLNKNSHPNPHLQSSWNKYGEENFVFEVIEDVLRNEYLLVREQWFLDNIIRWGIDYNIARKTSDVMRGRTHSDESKRKMSESRSGENHRMFGKHHSDETKRKISESLSGENNPMFGKSHSDETKRKMSESLSGENNPMFGKSHSDESKRKISEYRSGEKGSNSRLTENDVLEIREMYATGEYLQSELAEMFDCARRNISSIVNRETWKHI